VKENWFPFDSRLYTQEHCYGTQGDLWQWLPASHSHSTSVSMTATDNDEEDCCYGNVISLSPVLLLSMPKGSWLLTEPPMPNRYLACFRTKRDRYSGPYVGDGAWV
jgi:hypothetical protein